MPSGVAEQQQRGQRHVRRLLWVFGVAGTVWFLSGHALDRMREARVRAMRDRKEKDLLRSHFTSLLSTISFTLYALLPTLSPQLVAAYPVEATSQAIQGLSNPVSSQASIDGRSEILAQPGDGVVSGSGAAGESSQQMRDTTQDTAQSIATSTESSTSGDASTELHAQSGYESGVPSSMPGGIGESSATEFEQRTQAQHDDGHDVQSFGSETGVENSPTTSVSLSLAPTDLPTDMSSTSGSPPSNMSMSAQLYPSPPRRRSTPPPPATRTSALSMKSKKELWTDLKVQSLTRTLTTAYLLPLLYILTSSQLATLARIRYLEDVKSALPSPPAQAGPSATRPRPATARAGKQTTSWLGSFSVEALGLSEFVDETTSLLPNPVAMLPTAVSRFLPSWTRPSSSQAARTGDEQDEAAAQERLWQEEADRAEAERVYLSYSWWLLNEGWRTVAARVEEGVQRIFATMPLKRELALADWDGLIREVRMSVETVQGSDLFDFTETMLPPVPLPETSSACPLPVAPPSEHLASLLDQTRSHITSPDGRYLLNKGVEAMIRRLLESMQANLYDDVTGQGDILPTVRSIDDPHVAPGGSGGGGRRRLVDCLPEINRWGKGVWEAIPDGGVEALLALPEFEGFAALVFGDWAPR